MTAKFYYSKQQTPRTASIQQETIAGSLFTGSTNLSETLNLTLKVFRGRFTDFLVPQLITYSPIIVGFPFILSFFGNVLAETSSTTKTVPEMEAVVAMLFWVLVILLIFSFLYPFCAIVNCRIASNELHCGHSNWQQELKDNFWTRYWLMVFSLAIVNISVMLIVGSVFIVITLILTAVMTTHPPSAGTSFIIGFFSVILVFAIILLAMAIPFLFYLIEPICALEKVKINNITQLLLVGPVEQIKRTWVLVKPNFFKFLGISIVVLIITNVIQSIFLIPLNLAAFIYELYQASVNNLQTGDIRILWVEIVKQSAGTIVTILFAPVYSILKTVLYYQTRIDKENYDLELLLANLPDPPSDKQYQNNQELNLSW